MTSKQRAYLMSLASNLNPIFQVGKSSLTPELTAAIGESFNNNELIKIGVLKNCFDDPRAIAEWQNVPTPRWYRSSAKKSYCISRTRTSRRSNCPVNRYIAIGIRTEG